MAKQVIAEYPIVGDEWEELGEQIILNSHINPKDIESLVEGATAPIFGITSEETKEEIKLRNQNRKQLIILGRASGIYLGPG